MNKSNGPMFGIGVAGFLVGGLIAFLARPSAFLIGQLPIGVVISRGAFLKGMDQMLVSLAQRSFNVMLIGAIIGGTAGIIIGHFVGKRKMAKNQVEAGMKKCSFCAEMVKKDAIVCRYCGKNLEPLIHAQETKNI